MFLTVSQPFKCAHIHTFSMQEQELHVLFWTVFNQRSPNSLFRWTQSKREIVVSLFWGFQFGRASSAFLPWVHLCAASRQFIKGIVGFRMRFISKPALGILPARCSCLVTWQGFSSTRFRLLAPAFPDSESDVCFLPSHCPCSVF